VNIVISWHNQELPTATSKKRTVNHLAGERARWLAAHILPLEPQLRAWVRRSVREVRTPSRWQVRQPIYSQSVDRWRHYEPYLDELRHALGPLAASDDINTTPQE
jgi:hypothetical protein